MLLSSTSSSCLSNTSAKCVFSPFKKEKAYVKIRLIFERTTHSSYKPTFQERNSQPRIETLPSNRDLWFAFCVRNMRLRVNTRLESCKHNISMIKFQIFLKRQVSTISNSTFTLIIIIIHQIINKYTNNDNDSKSIHVHAHRSALKGVQEYGHHSHVHPLIRVCYPMHLNENNFHGAIGERNVHQNEDTFQKLSSHRENFVARPCTEQAVHLRNHSNVWFSHFYMYMQI